MSSTPLLAADNPHSQCCNENTGEGCGLDFSGKTAPGLCQKCTLLNSLDPVSPKYQLAVNYPQCSTCGVAWQRLPYTDQCGPCNKKSMVAAGIINHSVETALQARSNAFNIRTNRPPRQNALAATPAIPTIELNTAALDQFRNVAYNDADCVKVYAEPRLVNKIDASLGTTSRSYPPTTLMQEIKSDLLKGWNIAWLKKHVFPLLLENSELRFHGNQNILENTEYLAVLDFYQVHKTAGNHEAYFTKLPRHAAAMKGRVLALELWVESVDPDDPTPSSKSSKASAAKGSASKKRKSAATAAKENEEVGSKRAKVSTIESSFERLLPGPNPEKSTVIQVKIASISVDAETCTVRISWPTDSETAATNPLKALIADEIFKSGKMKHCYKLSIGEDQYVAKHFFEIGRGQDEVTLDENKTNLAADATRCEMARWFLKRFRDHASTMNVPIAENFEITQVLLVEEVVTPGNYPSPASGVTPEVLESSQDGRIIWLLEPLRNAAVTRYTGTMEHPAGTGQLAHTLSAFVHYAFQHSGGQLIFADIQGSCGRLSTKMMGILIFDIMSHTPEEDSGVGDHGTKGIERWRDQHDCNAFCKRLELEVGDSGDEGDDE
ncbi:kinase-like domain-containing protein [Mycena leptocephala]|nr:kinase-like domain-containing protein [Mycena leptocephala]